MVILGIQAVTIEWLIRRSSGGISGGIFAIEDGNLPKSATSTTVDHTWLLRLDPSSVDLGKTVCINDSMVGLSPGNDFTAKDEYLTRRWANDASVWQDRRYQRCSRTLSSGLNARSP